METGSRFFRADLADETAGRLRARAAPVIALSGSAVRGDVRANQVGIYGVDERFWKLTGRPHGPTAPETVVVNEALARKLGVKAGDEIQVLMPRPSAIGGETPLPGQPPQTVRPYVTVAAVDSADFSLRAQQGRPLNAFVPLSWLAGKIEQGGRANLLLLGDGELSVRSANEAVRQCLELADLQLAVRPVPGTSVIEVRSDAVFLPAPVERAVRDAGIQARGVLAYFVNRIVSGDRSSPYAVVAGVERGDPGAPGADLNDDEIVVNAWLAEDLGLRGGQEVALEYFVPGAGGGLETRSRRFRVRAGTAAIEAPGADRTLMPDYPGLKDIRDCRHWRPGVSLTDPIRPKDEQYWREHKGAPKAYVTLAAARSMWANRFGTLTAFRLPAADAEKQVTQALRKHLPAEAMGLAFRPVRQENLRAAGGGTDFSQLFLALSFFLIGSAVLLLALLFSLGVAQRAGEGGALLAMGFSPRQVRGVLLGEAAVAAVAGGLAGVGLGWLYTQLLLGGLATFWQDATTGCQIAFHAAPASIAAGLGGGLIVALAAMRLSLHWRLRLPVRQLLGGADTVEAVGSPGGVVRKVVLRLLVLAGVAWVAFVLLFGTPLGAEGEFFLSGALLLCLGIGACGAVIEARARRTVGVSLAALARRNAARRMRRSLTVVGALACGCFLVVAVGASRTPPPRDPPELRGGQGGFALYAETAVPVVTMPAVPPGLDLKIVRFRLRPGDAADCFNLARAQQPRLLGVDPKELTGRFRFVRAVRPGAVDWSILGEDFGPDVLPAVGDEPTVTWALGLAGDKTLRVVDEAGRTRRLKVVGVLAGSILQGNLIVGERQFTQAWPSLAGCSVFLTETREAGGVREWLRRGLQDFGVDVETTSDRLAAFQKVENTYLSIFGVLGAIGLALGSAALAVLVAHNVQARRGELAILRAVGFDRRAIRRLVLREHLLLVALGLAVGVVAGVVAVVPAVATMHRPVAVVPLAGLLACVAAAAVVWVHLAASWALRGELLAALRNE
jgi:ABC-type lipoprotein release transport system permease subunit